MYRRDLLVKAGLYNPEYRHLEEKELRLLHREDREGREHEERMGIQIVTGASLVQGHWVGSRSS